MDVFKDCIRSINEKTGNLIDENPDAEKEYVPYIVNKAYSMGIDTLLYANEMNKLNFLPNKMQYDFYYYGIDKGKRWNKWAKKQQVENLDLVKDYFQCSTQKAKEYLKLLSSDDIEQIKKETYTGEVK